MRLSVQEDLGNNFMGAKRATYKLVRDKVPQRVIRAVALVNEYDNRSDRGFSTHEDRSVKYARYAAYVVVIVPILFVIFPLLGFNLVSIPISVLVFVLLNFVFGPVLRDANLADFLASRIAGVPARPRRYIAQAIQKGQVDTV